VDAIAVSNLARRPISEWQDHVLAVSNQNGHTALISTEELDTGCALSRGPRALLLSHQLLPIEVVSYAIVGQQLVQSDFTNRALAVERFE